MSGTFTISVPSATPIDVSCVVKSMKLLSLPSGPLTFPSYDPVDGIPVDGTFTLCTVVNGVRTQWYNFPVWSNPGFPRGVAVPITPEPPPATPLPNLVCTACPPGCSMEIVTV
jgi:hypothetical protein